ncbi:MAG: B12-binding domain-containing radical SAM protein [Bacteroidetes bacterium]|nr:B12-binding domain-containing radical SAM protein [Bacteroidota bacterium]
MSTILITHSYFLEFDPKQLKLGQPYPPLATLYAASVVRNLGYQVEFFDTMFEKSALQIEAVIKKNCPDYLIICDDGFNYLTKMCLTNMRDAAFEMAKIGKRYGCKVIISSSDSTDHSNEYLDNSVDYIIVGEVEQTLQELLTALELNNSTESIPGLIFTANNKRITTSKRDVLKQLDSLPTPAWDLVDMEMYKSVWLKKHNYFSLNYATTRGCPFKCNWCAKPIYGNRYNCHSPLRVVTDLKYLVDNFGASHFWFSDDIFGLKPGWVKEFADLIEKFNVKIKFKIQSRVDLLLEENTIKLLAKAGCDIVWVGAESGSQKILDAMDKGTTVEQIYNATKLMKLHGIKPAFFLQFGYLGETKDDIKLTIKMLDDLLPFDIGASVSYPLPGTKFYEMVKSDLYAKSNWTDSDELLLMFKNTYSPSFYKQLHRFIHKNYRKRQAIQSIQAAIANPLKTDRDNIYKAFSYLYYLPTSFLEKIKLRLIK